MPNPAVDFELQVTIKVITFIGYIQTLKLPWHSVHLNISREVCFINIKRNKRWWHKLPFGGAIHAFFGSLKVFQNPREIIEGYTAF